MFEGYDPDRIGLEPAKKSQSTWLDIHALPNDEEVEIHRCPFCNGVFGVDSTFVDQVGTKITCPMCETRITVGA